MSSTCKCCDIEKVCGYSLWHGVMFTGIAAIVISFLALATSIACLGYIAFTEQYINNKPVVAINLLFALFSACVSMYQIIISSLLIWKTLRSKNSIFVCSVWYVSHLSILPLYFFFFSASTIVCFLSRKYGLGAIVLLGFIIYESVFIYFAIILNSYMQTLDRARYFF